MRQPLDYYVEKIQFSGGKPEHNKKRKKEREKN